MHLCDMIFHTKIILAKCWCSTERCVHGRVLFFVLSVYYGDVIKKKEVRIVAGQVAVA